MRQRIVQTTLVLALSVLFAGLTVFLTPNTTHAQVKTSRGATFCSRQGNFFWCHETLYTFAGNQQPVRYERQCRYLVDNHGRKGIRVGCYPWSSRQQSR